MPTDVSLDVSASSTNVFEASPSQRLPIGVGLILGACASVALWTFIGFGVRALIA